MDAWDDPEDDGYAARRTRVYAADRRGTRRPRRSKFGSCLLLFAVGSIGAVVILLGLLLASDEIVKPIVADAIPGDIAANVRGEVQSQIVSQIEQATTGEVVITADDINQRLAASHRLGAIDDATVQITPGGLVVSLNAYGLSGAYRSNVHASDGALLLDSGSIDGPLGLVIPTDEITAAVNDEIAAALANAGYRVDAVTMLDGAMVLAVSR